MRPISRSPILVSILVCATGLTTASARAAPPRAEPHHEVSVGDALSGPAKAEYSAARLLFGDHDYSGALVKFQHAFELSGDARLLWNMAVCEKNLRRYAHVLHLVERYEREGGSLLSDADHAEARELKRTVQSLVSSIRVVANQDGATVLVDGEPMGKTPLPGPLLVDLGTRHVSVRKDGYREQGFDQEITGASEVVLTIDLQPVVHEARLSVNAGKGQIIALDGKTLGESRWEGRLASGSHVVRVTAPGMRPYESDVELHDEELRSLDVSLEPESHGGGAAAFLITGGVVLAAGLATGAYFLFRPGPTTTIAPAYTGTLAPGVIQSP